MLERFTSQNLTFAFDAQNIIIIIILDLPAVFPPTLMLCSCRDFAPLPSAKKDVCVCATPSSDKVVLLFYLELVHRDGAARVGHLNLCKSAQYKRYLRSRFLC